MRQARLRTAFFGAYAVISTQINYIDVDDGVSFHIWFEKTALSVTLNSHYLRPSTDLIDFAWGAHEMHCCSIRLVKPHKSCAFGPTV